MIPLIVRIIEVRVLTENMKRSAVRERGREVGPGDHFCAWRLEVTLWHDPSPRFCGVALMSFWVFLTSVLGPRNSDIIVSSKASQPPEQAITFHFLEMLRDNVTKQGSRSHCFPRAAPFLTVS